MILNSHALGRRKNCASSVELRCVKTHAHVGNESPEHEYEVGRFDVLPNVFVASHGPATPTEIKRMVFRNCAFAQKISGNRNVHSFRHSHYQTSGAIPR